MATSSETRWNGEPCEARKVVVIVADAGRFPNYWARPFVGQERDAVEVTYAGSTFYIDDEGYERGEQEKALLEKFGMPASDRAGYPGYGWAKVTAGGGPHHPHSSLEIERVVRERA
jgi:hypothetical protein